MLIAVERIRPEMAESTDALRVLLQEAAVDADNAFTEHPRRVDLAEMGRERQLFVDYVR